MPPIRELSHKEGQRLKLFTDKSLEIIIRYDVDSNTTINPGYLKTTLNKHLFLLDTFAANFRDAEELKTLIDRHLKELDRKAFLSAIKEKQTYINSNDDEKYLTDCKTAATFWVCNALFSEIYVAHKLPKEQQEKAREYLTQVIAAKIEEITRNRTKGKGRIRKSLMFTNKLNMIISSLTPKDYTAAGSDELTAPISEQVVPGGADLKEIKAIRAEGTLKAFDTNAAMVYMILQSELANNLMDDKKTAEQQRAVSISLKDYMDKRGLSDKKSAAKSLEAAADSIISFRAVIKDILGLDGFETTGVSISDKARYENGYFTMIFTDEFVKYIRQGHIIEAPDNIYKISLKRPNAFFMALKLCFHSGYNKQKNRRSANPHLIKVENLLKECRYIPRYEDIKETGQIYDRIISPFIAALETIALPSENGFISYEYTHAKGEPLTPSEREALESGRISYDEFIELYVKFEILDAEKPKTIDI